MGAEAACGFLTTQTESQAEPQQEPAAGGARPLTLAGLLAADPVSVADPVAFTRAACVDGDPGLALALAAFPADVVARHVLAAFQAAVQASNDEARAYGDLRRRAMPQAYRSGFAAWSKQDPEAARRPSSRSVAADLASRGPAEWLILETWPLARVLRYLEDLSVAAFLREIDEMTADTRRRAPAGRRHA